jgi:hypothetical protein
MPVDITLAKAKYRPTNRRLNLRDKIDPHCNMGASELCPKGTWTYMSGSYTSKSSNAGTASKVKTIAPRRRAYGPW